MKRIKAMIHDDGEINLEFVGFKGDECTETREKLQEILLEFGVKLNPEKIMKKSPSQISPEISKNPSDLGSSGKPLRL